MERDASSPTLDTLYKLAAAFGITYLELSQEINEVEENQNYLTSAIKEVEEIKAMKKIRSGRIPIPMEVTMQIVQIIERKVSRFNNEFNDEIEMEIIKYQDHYKVVVTICQEEPPFKDYIGIGMDRRSARRAARKALSNLYKEAYG